jgi:hypothetical protein
MYTMQPLYFYLQGNFYFYRSDIPKRFSGVEQHFTVFDVGIHNNCGHRVKETPEEIEAMIRRHSHERA